MCYVLDFEFDDSYKACKFTAFPRTFQIINYIFFKEVYNHKVYRVLRIKNNENKEPRELALWVHVFFTSIWLLGPLAPFGCPKKRRFGWCRP